MSLSSLIWQVADLLRGDYKPHEYGQVILPFTVLRRMDCVLEPTKAKVLAEAQRLKGADINPEPFLERAAGLSFYNSSPLTMKTLMGDQDHLRENLNEYLRGFSPSVRDIFEYFGFASEIDRLADSKLLYLVTERFANFDLHPNKVSNDEMGHVFEELIRKFADASNFTAGEHFTPRDVIRLMVDLLYDEDHDDLGRPGIVRTVYDPTAGTGGMLTVAGDALRAMNPDAKLVMFGQELNKATYAICKADLLIKGQDVRNIAQGDTLANDGHRGRTFDYMLSNPPFGVEWKKSEKEVRREYEQQGYSGRFGPGLPRISDGSLLFMLNLVAKMRPVSEGGSRFCIVQNGSPLFTGGAGSGESEIRRYLLEHDLVEAIVALPGEMFFNTGIATYLWVVSNSKKSARKGKLQLIDATDLCRRMRRNLGSKRNELSDDHIAEITRLFHDFEEVRRPSLDENGQDVPVSLIFSNQSFGYRTITVERPLRDELGEIVRGTKGKLNGKPLPNPKLRDTENVPLSEDVDTYFRREVLPHAPDAWVDDEKTKVGYEIPFNRYFFVFKPARALAEIDTDLKVAGAKIQRMLAEADNINFPQYPKYKDSRLDSISEVPAHWDIVPIKRVSQLQSGDSITSELIEPEGEYPVYGGNGLRGYTNAYTHEGEYVLIGRQGALCGNVNYANGRFWASEHAVVAEPISHYPPRWFGELLRSMNLGQYSIASAQPGLAVDLIRNLYIPVPPQNEQRGMSQFLKQETEKIDKLIEAQRRLIDLLDEKREALISSAVTGKIDVRNYSSTDAPEEIYEPA